MSEKRKPSSKQQQILHTALTLLLFVCVTHIKVIFSAHRTHATSRRLSGCNIPKGHATAFNCATLFRNLFLHPNGANKECDLKNNCTALEQQRSARTQTNYRA